jgi:hypothetical protein
VSEDVKMTPRLLWFGVFKIAVVLTTGLLLAAFLVSQFFAVSHGAVANVTLNAFLLAIAVSILASGFLTILKIVDWFEARRTKRGNC